MKKRLVGAFALAAAAAVVLSSPAASAAASASASTAASSSAEDAQTEPVSAQNESQSGSGDEEWRYNTYYIFPQTRHMKDTSLPKYGQYALYPLAAVCDVVQLPIGALAGLLGE